MEKKYFLLIKETLGEVIGCMVEAIDREDARYLLYSVFREGSGKYLTYEITEKDFKDDTFRKWYYKASYKHYYNNNLISGEGNVFCVFSGRISVSDVFKQECLVKECLYK